MNKAFRSLCAVMVLLVLAAAMCLPVSAAAQSVTITVGSSPVAANGGSTVSLPIGIQAVSAGSTRIAGLSLSVSYDKTKLTYVDSPIVTGIPDLNSTTIYHNATTAVINLAWSGSSSVDVSALATLYTITFRVLSGAADSTNITVKINELYDATASGTNITYNDIAISGANPVNKVILFSASNDPMVKSANDAIEAIGTVTYTAQCLEKINYAAYRYSLLNANQKSMVANYQMLLDKQMTYSQLKYEASQKPVDDEISAYISKHSRVLSLAVENVALTDMVAINTAYNDFQLLSAAAKNEIFDYNIKLKNMKTRITALQKAESDRQKAEEEERVLRQEAQENADGFRAANASLLKIIMSDLLPDHYAAINQALSTINMLSGLNPYIGDLLAGDRILLTNMMAKVQELIAQQGNGPSSAKLDSDKFRTSNSWVLSQTENSITADDMMDIRVALEVYRILDPDAQALLESEYALLNKLLAKSIELDSLDGGTGSTNSDSLGETASTGSSVTDVNTDNTSKPTNQVGNTGTIGNDDDNINSANGSVLGKVSLSIPVSILIFVFSFILFEGLQAYYHLYFKKKIAAEGNVE